MDSIDLTYLSIDDLLSDIKTNLEIYDTAQDNKFRNWIYTRASKLAKRGGLYAFKSPPIQFVNNKIELPANFKELGRFEIEVGGACTLILLRGEQSVFTKGCCNNSYKGDGLARGMIRNGLIELDSNVESDGIAHISYLGVNVDSNGYPTLFESYREPLRYYVLWEYFLLRGDSYKVAKYQELYSKRVAQLKAELNNAPMQELAEIGLVYKRVISY